MTKTVIKKKKIAKCKNTTTGEHLWGDFIVEKSLFFTRVARNVQQCAACGLVDTRKVK